MSSVEGREAGRTNVGHLMTADPWEIPEEAISDADCGVATDVYRLIS